MFLFFLDSNHNRLEKRGFFIISEGCMTCVFGKLVVFCTLVMHPAVSAVNSWTTQSERCLSDKTTSASDVMCYFVVLVIFCQYKHFHQIKQKVSWESNSFLRFKWNKYPIFCGKHIQIMFIFQCQHTWSNEDLKLRIGVLCEGLWRLIGYHR